MLALDTVLITGVLRLYNWSTWFEIFNDDVEVLGCPGSDIPTRMY
jgi:hypothetical protein